MSTADRPPPAPPFDLLDDLRAHDRERQAVIREREEINQRSNRVRLRARQIACRMLRLGIGTVEVDGWLFWPDPKANGLHRRQAPAVPSGATPDA